MYSTQRNIPMAIRCTGDNMKTAKKKYVYAYIAGWHPNAIIVFS